MKHVFLSAYSRRLHRILQGPDELIRLALPGQGLQPLDDPGQVLLLAQARRYNFANRRMRSGPPALVAAQQLFGESLPGTEARENGLDVDVGPQAAGTNQVVGEIENLDRLAHVEHVEVARLGQR